MILSVVSNVYVTISKKMVRYEFNQMLTYKYLLSCNL